MSKQIIHEKLQEIFREVFDNQLLQINEETGPANISDWNSLSNITLTISLEKEFNVMFELEDLQQMGNVGQIVDVIWNKINK